VTQPTKSPEERDMEPAAEKETEQEEQQLPQARKDDAPTAAATATAAEEDGADSEETERRNRDLKAGLHPLRVRNAAADRSSAPRSASH
jgi:hypothetical protein